MASARRPVVHEKNGGKGAARSRRRNGEGGRGVATPAEKGRVLIGNAQ